MKFRHSGEAGIKIELQMTPMIDIVFQLLIFFIMLFKMPVYEGDFNIRMPSTSKREGVPPPDVLPPLNLRMRAYGDGTLRSVRLSQRPIGAEIKDDEVQQRGREYAAKTGTSMTPKEITRKGRELCARARFDMLNNSIIEIVGDETGPNSRRATAEVEIDCDPQLYYDYVIGAITAVTGYKVDKQTVSLIEKIKFAPRRKKASG